MNANELNKLIENIKGRFTYRFMEDKESTIFITVAERDDIIRELSRTRIRVTATEPPTREDGGSGDHGQYVMARAKGNYWEEIQLIYVAENPDEYPHWTCVPQLPEVP